MGLSCTLVHKLLPLLETLITRNSRKVLEFPGMFKMKVNFRGSKLSSSLVEEAAPTQPSL